MNNPYEALQSQNHILTQFHQNCAQGNIELEALINAFIKMKGLDNDQAQKLHDLYGKRSVENVLSNQSDNLTQAIREAIAEANRNTTSVPVHRLAVVLAACFVRSIKDVQRLTSKGHGFIVRWLSRFLKCGLDGLRDKDRSGRPSSYDDEDLIIKINQLLNFKPRFLAELVEEWPHSVLQKIKYHDSWTIPCLSAVINISESTTRRFIRKHCISLAPNTTKTYCFSNDPNFEAKLSEVVNLYQLPVNAKDDKGRDVVVLNFDEKPSIAIRRHIYCANSRQVICNGSEYERLGICNLFAALEHKTGYVTCDFPDVKTRETVESFLTTVVTSDRYRNKRVHIILDNINTHYNFSQEWYAKFGDRVTLHYTPTHSSWANLVETFFSIFSRSVLKNASWNSIDEFKSCANRFIIEYNSQCKPYKWSFKNLQVYFDQRRNTIGSIKSVTETPPVIDFGIANHVISYNNTLCQAKNKLEEFNQRQQGKEPYHRSLYLVANVAKASAVLDEVLSFSTSMLDIPVFAPDVKRALQQAHDDLMSYNNAKINLNEAKTLATDASDTGVASETKLEIRELQTRFNKTVKTCLRSLKLACGAIFQDIETSSLALTLIDRLKQSEAMAGLTCKSPHTDGDMAHIWVNKIWRLINRP